MLKKKLNLKFRAILANSMLLLFVVYASWRRPSLGLFLWMGFFLIMLNLTLFAAAQKEKHF